MTKIIYIGKGISLLNMIYQDTKRPIKIGRSIKNNEMFTVWKGFERTRE